MTNNIAKNTSYFTFALILQKIISFTYFILVARSLAPADLGKYYFAVSFTTIFAIFIDLGMANVLTREVAKAKTSDSDTEYPPLRHGPSAEDSDAGHSVPYLLSTVLSIKIPLAVLSLTAVAILVNIMGYPALTRDLVYLASAAMVLDSFTLTFFAYMRGRHNLFFESIAVVAFQLIMLVLGLSFLRAGLGLRWLMGALVIASAFNFLYSSLLLKFRWRLPWRLKINYGLIKNILIITIPFGLFAVFQRVYMYLDTVFLSFLAGDSYVGLYQIAFKIVFALQFLPMAFTASLYPAFAGYWKQKEADRLAVTFERGVNYLIIISLPISIGIITLADKIILLFSPEYAAAVLPLRIIMASLFFIFINFPIGSLLNACDRQKINTRNMGLALAASIILNLILIPKFQVVGASVTVIITNFLMFILGITWVPRIITGFNPGKIIKVFFKAALSVIVMAGLIIYLKAILSIFIIIPLAGLIYFIILFILGGFRKEDVISIFNSFYAKNKISK